MIKKYVLVFFLLLSVLSFFFVGFRRFLLYFSLSDALVLAQITVDPPCDVLEERIGVQLDSIWETLEHQPLWTAQRMLRSVLRSIPSVVASRVRIDWSGRVFIQVRRSVARFRLLETSTVYLDQQVWVSEWPCGDEIWGVLQGELCDDELARLLRFLQHESSCRGSESYFSLWQNRWLWRRVDWAPAQWGDLFVINNCHLHSFLNDFLLLDKQSATFYLSSNLLYMVPRR